MRDMLIAGIVPGLTSVCIVRPRGRHSRSVMLGFADSALLIVLRVPGARRVLRAAAKERPSPVS